MTPQPLQDPREVAAEAVSEASVRSRAINDMLTGLHGAQAFREYIITHKPGATVPEV